MNIDSSFAIEMLRHLVQMDTCNPPGHERAAAMYLEGILRNAGFQTEIDVFDENRANLIARWKGAHPGRTIALCGHLDTVPVRREDWTHDPHAAAVEGGVMFGRGTADMKGGIAAMVSACLALASGPSMRGDVVFLATAGEEVDCIGATRLAGRKLGPIDALIIGEPTRLRPVVTHKGALWLELETRGVAAHGSMPEQGYSAIVSMHRVLHEVLGRRLPHDTQSILTGQTQSIGVIQGGTGINIVPDRCRTHIDIRTQPAQRHEDIVAEFRRILEQVGRDDSRFQGEVKILANRPAVDTPAQHPFIQTVLAAVTGATGQRAEPSGAPYFTDGSVLQPALEVPVLILGPGDERLAHQADEHIPVQDVVDAAAIYTAIVRENIERHWPAI